MKTENIETYLSDASNYKGNASGVYSPKNLDEIRKIIKECSAENIPMTFQGARTGLTGSGISDSGVVISSENLDNIYYDEKTQKVKCGSGVVHKDLDDFLRNYNRFLPPNPTETLSMIGGNVGTNASGSRTYKYGSMRNWVSSLKVILPSGEILKLDRNNKLQNSRNNQIILKSENNLEYKINISDIGMPNIKHAAGYFLKSEMQAIDLFIGSEGTLGFIFEIELETLPLPNKLLGLIIFFDSDVGMLDFVESLQNKRNKGDPLKGGPRLIEYFGENALRMLREFYPQIPNDSVGAIWVEEEISETDDDYDDEILEKWLELITEYSGLSDQTWTAQNVKEHRFFAEFRHKLPEEIYENLANSSKQKIGTDCAVPREKFREYFLWLFKKLDEIDLSYLVFGHIGNSHVHANVFYENDEQMKKAQLFYQQLVSETINLGGTVSAEHGIGKIKKEYLQQMFAHENLKIMKNIKKMFDPKNIFGRGNLFLDDNSR